MTVNSLQRIFNAAWEQFIVKDNPPAIEEGSCKYLTSDGRKCAIGLCIPDGHPAQDYGGDFVDLVKHYQDLFPDLQDDNKCSLFFFQERLHDNLVNNDTGEWFFTKDQRKEKYLAVAKEYDLTIPERSS